MNEAPKTFAKREVQQGSNGRKAVVTRLVTPEPKPAIEARKQRR
jgi:hypothetical protein